MRSKLFSTLAVGLALSACAATAAAPNLLLAIHPRPAQAQRPIAQRDAPANQNQLSSEKNNGTDDKVDPEWKKQLEKEAKEDERFAATCNPLKSKVNSLLQSSSAGIRAFNEAFSAVKHLQNQWSGSCPDRIRLVSGFVEKTVPCYNATYLVRLSDGDYYSISPSSTQLFGPAQGWASKELVIGITLRQTSCVSSISPTIVYPAIQVSAAARRNWNDSDREKFLADHAAVLARKNTSLDTRIRELNQMIATSKGASALASISAAYLDKGDYAHALEKIDMAITLEPTNPEWLMSRCWTRAMANRGLTDGLNDCNKALDMRANYPNALGSRGYIYLRLREYDKAIADFDASLRKTVDWENAWPVASYGRGLARMSTGDKQGMEDIKKALEVNIDIDDRMAVFGFTTN